MRADLKRIQDLLLAVKTLRKQEAQARVLERDLVSDYQRGRADALQETINFLEQTMFKDYPHDPVKEFFRHIALRVPFLRRPITCFYNFDSL